MFHQICCPYSLSCVHGPVTYFLQQNVSCFVTFRLVRMQPLHAPISHFIEVVCLDRSE